MPERRASQEEIPNLSLPETECHLKNHRGILLVHATYGSHSVRRLRGPGSFPHSTPLCRAQARCVPVWKRLVLFRLPFANPIFFLAKMSNKNMRCEVIFESEKRVGDACGDEAMHAKAKKRHGSQISNPPCLPTGCAPIPYFYSTCIRILVIEAP